MFYVNENIKPVAVPPRAVPYHLKSRYDKAINEMIEADVIEEHLINEPALWISNSVIAPKPNDEIRITLDARSVNKAIQSNNHPIPRPDDRKAQLAGSKIFSKLDFKSAFLQLELAPESRYHTTFHGKFYRYKRKGCKKELEGSGGRSHHHKVCELALKLEKNYSKATDGKFKCSYCELVCEKTTSHH